MSEVSVINQAEMEDQASGQLELPPGFRFHPTDEEVVTDYLTHKAVDRSFTSIVIGEVDLNKCEPWDLPAKAKMGEKEWYFFFHKDRKYPTGTRANRATETGYWKATGKDREIFRGGILVGMKKTLVFYRGRAPRGEKTGWVMHEFRLEGKLPHSLPRSAKDEWAVCKVFNKDLLAAKTGTPMAAAGAELDHVESLEFLSEFLDSAQLPPLMDPTYGADVDEVIDFKGLASTSGHHGAAPSGGSYPPLKMEEQYLHHDQQRPQTFHSCASPYFSLPAANAGDDVPAAIRRYCKAEQKASVLSPSRETGLSADPNAAAGYADISSAATPSSLHQHNQFLQELDDPLLNLADIWKY